MSVKQGAAKDRFEPDEENRVQAHYSSISLHRKCPQAWYYRYGLKLEQVSDAPTPYRTLGTWWSALRALESLGRGVRAETMRFVPKKLEDKSEGFAFDLSDESRHLQVFPAASERWQRMSAVEREAFEAALGGSLPDRLEHMFALWSAAAEERHEREHPIGVEVFWKRELPRPEGDAAWSLIGDQSAVPRMHLLGYIDELYYDRERRMNVVRDDKTKKDLSRSTSSLDDLMDSQLMLYPWGVAPLLKREGIEAVRGVGYDRVRSVAPKSPQLTATGGLSKSVTDYDLETYAVWATEDTRPWAVAGQDLPSWAAEQGLDAEAARALSELPAGRFWGKAGDFLKTGPRAGQAKFGIYQPEEAVMERLGGEVELLKWTHRTLKPLNRQMIQTHLRAAVDTSLDIWQTQMRAEATGEAARNLDRLGCEWCDFKHLCRAQIVGGAQGEYDLAAYGLRVKEKR